MLPNERKAGNKKPKSVKQEAEPEKQTMNLHSLQASYAVEIAKMVCLYLIWLTIDSAPLMDVSRVR